MGVCTGLKRSFRISTVLVLMSYQIGPGLICARVNLGQRESEYGLLVNRFYESNESMSLSPSYILLCNSLPLIGFEPILGMEVSWDNRHQLTTSLRW